MRGIILAGGTGSRLWPMTKVVSKQLLPVYDKPMIYYPLTTLIELGIHDILVITDAKSQSSFQDLLQDGTQWGLRISYAVQDEPRGIAEALIIGDSFIGAEGDVVLVLGDNIFHSTIPLSGQHSPYRRSTVYSCAVSNPQDYGVLNWEHPGPRPLIVEKPKEFIGNEAVVGIYAYRNGDHRLAKTLVPSSRGELEITDLNNMLIQSDRADIFSLDSSSVWLDTGTVHSLDSASEYVRVIEERQGKKLGCVEAAAWERELISDAQLYKLALPLVQSGYGQYLLNLLPK